MAEEMMTKAAAMRGDGQMTMVHRIALAIDKAAGTYSEDVSCWYDHARAALEAMREPTPEMTTAFHHAVGRWMDDKDFTDEAVWHAQIDAALLEAEHG